MKKNTLCLLFIFFLLVFSSGVSAQTKSTDLLLSSSASGASAAAMAEVKPQEPDYQLPYPGLLPDNPFYIFKTARDKVVSLLISDPLKKAEFNVLQADKRLSAAVMLLNKKNGKEDLAESTISKGQNYFEDAITRVKDAKKEGLTINDISQKMSHSAKKHISVLRDLQKKVSSGNKEKIGKLIERMKQLDNKVSQLTSEK